ncbi:hypothetical protein MalM25_12350 [Planctomycetes bacterium MalM25]|nr:hypothetical protein MalM25_12350 [Planctomycetes bacterium MalM25]
MQKAEGGRQKQQAAQWLLQLPTALCLLPTQGHQAFTMSFIMGSRYWTVESMLARLG